MATIPHFKTDAVVTINAPLDRVNLGYVTEHPVGATVRLPGHVAKFLSDHGVVTIVTPAGTVTP